MTHTQRFDVTATSYTVYAPYSWGSPSMTIATDYSVFRKSVAERAEIKMHKKEVGKSKNHKFKTLVHIQS